MNTTVFCEPEFDCPTGWQVSGTNQPCYETKLNNIDCLINFHFLAANDGFWQCVVDNKPIKICYSLANSVKYCEEESLKVESSFVYSYSYVTEVFELDNEEYHFTGNSWSIVSGSSLEPVYSDVLEEKLNKLYKEWKTKEGQNSQIKQLVEEFKSKQKLEEDKIPLNLL